MSNYYIEHTHTRESIISVLKYQFELSNGIPLMLGYFVCTIFLVIGAQISSVNTPVSILLMMLSCWVIVAIGQIPNRRAKKVADYYGSNFPKIHYSFESNSIKATFTGTNSTDTIPYNTIQFLLENKQYCYICLKSGAVYLFCKDNITNLQPIKDLIAKKTNLNWSQRKPLSILITQKLFRR